MKIELTTKEISLIQSLPREIKEIFNLPEAVADIRKIDKNIVIDVNESYLLKMGEEYKTLAYGFFGIGATAAALVRGFSINIERIHKEFMNKKEAK